MHCFKPNDTIAVTKAHGILDFSLNRLFNRLLRHPQSEEILPHVQMELPMLQVVPIAPCPVARNH